MVKNGIKIYARVRDNEYNKTSISYEILPKDEYEDVVFSLPRDPQQIFAKACAHKFRFHKVFGRESTQADVFDVIAKPVVNSVLNGYNGTIFAYGQTGSGKTYSITGSSHVYDNRGIIPRSIQHVFEYANNNLENHTIYISYLEIYNETGFDLLNTVKSATNLEELPRVTLLEDSKGECHLRNLSIIPVQSEQDAMRLLYLGDTNRTLAETPMNEYSSRSHCIFTVYVAIRDTKKKQKIRRAKLHLVDLAGSERLNKSNRTLITEARHINLSLHYLEQVITALSEDNRSHIPFRNSMMTFMLKDSLAGNSLTAMLATLSADYYNVEETITTCKFAQRVAMVYTEVTINEEIDPQEEILSLKAEILILKKQIKVLSGAHNGEVLSINQVNHCKNLVEKFINDPETNMDVGSNLLMIQECFNILREKILEKGGCSIVNNHDKEAINKYQELLKEKENDISTLTSLLQDGKSPILEVNNTNVETLCNCPQYDDMAINSFCGDSSNSKCIIEELEDFKRFTCNNDCYLNVEHCRRALEEKQSSTNTISKITQQCQDNITKLRCRLEYTKDQIEIDHLNNQLIKQHTIYHESLQKYKNASSEIEYLNYGYEQAKLKLQKQFESWCNENKNKNTPRENVSSQSVSSACPISNANNTRILEGIDANFVQSPHRLQKSKLTMNNSSDFVKWEPPPFDERSNYKTKYSNSDMYQPSKNYLKEEDEDDDNDSVLWTDKARNQRRKRSVENLVMKKSSGCKRSFKNSPKQKGTTTYTERLLASKELRLPSGSKKDREVKSQQALRSYDYFETYAQPLHPQREYFGNYSSTSNFENQCRYQTDAPPSANPVHSSHSANYLQGYATENCFSSPRELKPRAQQLHNAYSTNTLLSCQQGSMYPFSRTVSRCSPPVSSRGAEFNEETWKPGRDFHERPISDRSLASERPWVIDNSQKSFGCCKKSASSVCVNFSTEKEHGVVKSSNCHGSVDDPNIVKVSEPIKLCKEEEFAKFMEGVPMTGDPEVDEEITNFYKSKFNLD